MNMKVTQTIQAADAHGNPITFMEPVEMKWYEGDNPLDVMLSVAQLLRHAEDRKFTKTLAIHIEM